MNGAQDPTGGAPSNGGSNGPEFDGPAADGRETDGLETNGLEPGRARSAPPRLARRWFDLLLRAFPLKFRRHFGASMRQTFGDRYRERRGRGRGAVVGMLVRLTLDMVVAGLAERRRRPGRRSSGKSGQRGQMSDHLRQDVVFAVRSLTRNPVFAVAAVLTLALGVGATTSIFSLVNGVLLTPLPYEEADRLVTVYAATEEEPGREGYMSRPDIEDVATLPALDALVGYASGNMTLTGMGAASVVPGTRVSGSILSVFGLRPVLGRDLRPEDTREGAHRVVVVSYGFWQERLGGAADVLGRTLELQGEGYEIVGVAPEGFDYPDGSRIWRPYVYYPESCGRGCHVYQTIGRLSAGLGLDVLVDQTRSLAERLQEAHPNYEKVFYVTSLEERMVGDVRSELWILLAAVGLVLLVACANVANLLLARAQGRVAEVGVRAALGASRGRLLAQVLTESLVLALLGGAAGLGLAYGGVELVRTVSAGAVPRMEAVAVNGTVVLFTLGVVVLVAVLFGLSPALQLARSSPADALRRSRPGTHAGPARSRSRSLLLGAELALSVVLLIGAGLLLRTFERLHRVEPGYETENIVRFNLVLPEARYGSLEEISGFFQTLEERIRSVPGVVAAGAAFGAPLGGMNIVGNVRVEGRPEAGPGEETSASGIAVTPGYLETMGIPVLRGRGIEARDRADTEPVALVNQRFIQEVFPNEDPLGKRVRISAGFGYDSPYRTIVGVVPDVHSQSLTQEPVPELYVAQAQKGPGFVTMAVRTAPGVRSVLPAVRAEVRRLDPDLPLRGVETMRQALAEETAATRLYLTLLAVFAGLAVALAAVGLYGVVAYLVSRRRHEIGVRLALGAESGKVVAMVVREAARPAILGVAAGLLAALMGARVLQGFLFQVEPRDPLVFAGVTFVLVAVALAAALVPARQASRVDPVEALRVE